MIVLTPFACNVTIISADAGRSIVSIEPVTPSSRNSRTILQPCAAAYDLIAIRCRVNPSPLI